MRLIRRYIAPFFLTAALAAPLVAAPQSGVDVRVYDSGHKDYHNWDSREEKAWEGYVQEHHIKHHEFKKATKKEQADYWKWRHDHPDKR